MKRAFLCVLDSLGCGGAPDAVEFGDYGSNTLGHIAEQCQKGLAEEGRSGPLKMPNLTRLGLGHALSLSSDMDLMKPSSDPEGIWGVGREISNGKDTISGHWEMTGQPVPWEWYLFPDTQPTFPEKLIAEFVERAKIPGILANKHASGIPVIDEYAAEHIETGKPICYTSADSVFQIAAHEEHFGLEKLLDICKIAAEIFHPLPVGRVIARPFIGDEKSGYKRTSNRKDLAVKPPANTLLDDILKANGKVIAVGKISDIFSGQGISQVQKGKNDMDLFDKLVTSMDSLSDKSLIFANFVEFDTEYGHQRDVSGYARALEQFDARIPEVLAKLRDGDLLIFTADHGNDPTWVGNDHTREQVPIVGVLQNGGAMKAGLQGFVDIGATIANHLGIVYSGEGKSFL